AELPGPAAGNRQARRAEDGGERQGQPEEETRRSTVVRLGDGRQLVVPPQLSVAEGGDLGGAQLGENRNVREARVERIPHLSRRRYVFDVCGAEAEDMGEVARVRLRETLRGQAAELPRPAELQEPSVPRAGHGGRPGRLVGVE